ncbi:MAG TPA: PD-(D/E)XK nuclease family protein [Bacteroidota bacterium]|nr:PD-(D/E)XK nuclease family protein [Bacteroidota bacterium]
MSKHIVIAPGKNLIHEVVSRLDSSSNDFSASMIIFPGKRPAHFVRKALARRIGGSFLPPRIFSIDSFIDFLCSEKLGNIHIPLENLDAVALLFEIHTSLIEHIGGDHFTSVDRFVGLGLKLYAELEELVMADIRVRQVSDSLESVPLGRLQALPSYFQRFYELVEERGFSTRALRYRAVASEIGAIDLSACRDIIVAGFYALTPLEEKILGNLVRRENCTLVAQQGPGLMEKVKRLGIDIEAPDAAVPAPVPDCHFYKASDTHGQVFAVSSSIKAMVESGTTINERTAIVLPTADALFPIVRHALPLLPEDQYNIALGYPLRRTPLFGFLSALMDIGAGARNGEVPTREYAAFVLHPYTKNIRFGQRSDVTRVLFHTIETYLAEKQPGMYCSLESLEANTPLLNDVARSLTSGGTDIGLNELRDHLRTIHDQTIRKFLGLQSLGDCALRAAEILQYIYRHSTATRHRFFHPYAQRFIAFFESIQASLLAGHRFSDPASYFAFVRTAVETEEVPFAGTPLVGLQVLGLLETRNLSFDTVFLLNATDDVLPGSRGNDVLLPQPLREKLGLETYRQREQLTEYYFSLLLAGARTVHFFFSESGNHEKSRFLEKLLWEEQQKRNALDVRDLVHVVRYNVELSTATPDGIVKTDAVLNHLRQFEYTATALDTWLTCQLRFYYAHVLKLSEKEDIADDVGQFEVGSLVHDVLSRYFKPMVGTPMKAADLDLSRLRQIVDARYTEQYGIELVGASYLVRQQIARQLESFLTEYQKPLLERTGVLLSGLEEGFSVECDGFSFTGRIDRIERRGGQHVILDYKTGRDDTYVKINIDKLDPGNPDTWGAAIGSFQLPMYMLLYSEARRVPISSIVPAYLFLGRNRIGPDIETAIDKNHSPAEVFDAVRPVIFSAIKHILDPNERFEPTKNLQTDCPQCPYRALCGTSWTG